MRAAATSRMELVSCSCGRLFAPDRIQVHRRNCSTLSSCDGFRATRTPMDANPTVCARWPPLADYEGVAEHTVLVPCKHCGRRFAPERVERHRVACASRLHFRASVEALDAIDGPAPARGDLCDTVETDLAMDLIECENCKRRFSPERLEVAISSRHHHYLPRPLCLLSYAQPLQ